MDLDNEEYKATRDIHTRKEEIKKKANELIDMLKEYEEKDEEFFNDICTSVVACRKWEV
ncbi:MAG: hypothetical protein IKG42_04835 [Clostridia bacterium]|nr:hypothetical protein [Clostridia bacterium]